MFLRERKKEKLKLLGKKQKKQKGGAEPEPKTVRLDNKNGKYGFTYSSPEYSLGYVFITQSDIENLPVGSRITKINNESLTENNKSIGDINALLTMYPNYIILEYIHSNDQPYKDVKKKDMKTLILKMKSSGNLRSNKKL